MKTFVAIAVFGSIIFCGLMNAQTINEVNPPAIDSIKVSEAKQQQLILWTSGDREVALKMVFMYGLYSKKNGWMDNVRLLVWGPSSKLLAEDPELQKGLAELKEAGVELYACKACADLYGVSEKLVQLGITVMYTGKMLADLQKNGWYILSI